VSALEKRDEGWRLDYNHVRPHSAHAGLPPDAVRLNPAAGRLATPWLSRWARGWRGQVTIIEIVGRTPIQLAEILW